MADSKIRIALADDHKIFRQGIKAMLEYEPDFCVVGEAANGTDAVKLVEELKPDVLVVDIGMPELDGIQVTSQVRTTSPETAVVILSMQSSDAYVQAALKAGAIGYVVKETGYDHLWLAIREALAGRRYLGIPLSEPS